MARNPNEKKVNEIYETIQQHPGKRSGWIAAVLHIPRSDVTRTLPCLEERGLYVSEDEEGQLFPFRDKQK
jgi:DNA-binding MarR family transcriptional regulator